MLKNFSKQMSTHWFLSRGFVAGHGRIWKKTPRTKKCPTCPSPYLHIIRVFRMFYVYIYIYISCVYIYTYIYIPNHINHVLLEPFFRMRSTIFGAWNLVDSPWRCSSCGFEPEMRQTWWMQIHDLSKNIRMYVCMNVCMYVYIYIWGFP